jgi:hypothetical protein
MPICGGFLHTSFKVSRFQSFNLSKFNPWKVASLNLQYLRANDKGPEQVRTSAVFETLKL